MAKSQYKYYFVKTKLNIIFGFKMNSILNMLKIQELALSITEQADAQLINTKSRQTQLLSQFYKPALHLSVDKAITRRRCYRMYKEMWN